MRKRWPGVLLGGQGHLGADPPHRLPPHGGGRRERAQGGAGHPRRQPPVVRRPYLRPAPPARKVISLGKSDYFTGRGAKGFFTRLFFSGVGTVPIDRSGGKASEAALRTGLRVLSEGHLLGIYPEGTRSPDGRL